MGGLFENHAIITAASFTVTTEGNFNNNGVINADSLTVTAGDYL